MIWPWTNPKQRERLESDYKTVEVDKYADKLIDRMEKEVKFLVKELEEARIEIIRLTVANDELKNKLNARPSKPIEDVEMPRMIDSPMSARAALENASKNKEWMKGHNDKT